MNKLRKGSELARNKFLFQLMKQIELLNLFNKGSDRLSLGLDLTDSGWRVGVLDEIKTLLSPAGAWLWAELGNSIDVCSNHIFSMCLYLFTVMCLQSIQTR